MQSQSRISPLFGCGPIITYTPAAADTLTEYFRLSPAPPENFDLILTGDLGVHGTELLRDLLEGEEIDIRKNHADCGLMIYDISAEDKHAGGSGCGCSAAVLASHILKEMRQGKYRDVLFIGTGALMNPQTLMQGGSIPSVAHLVHLRARDKGGRS